MQYKHTQFDESVNVTPTSPVREFLKYLGGIAVLIALVYYISAWCVDLIVPHVDEKTEQWVWDHLFEDKYVAQDKRSASIVASERYVQGLLDDLPKDGLPAYNYKAIVIDSNMVNALALPSGKIVVYRGLIDKLHSENALVMVLGHELGHFAHHDHLRGMGRTLLATVLLAPLLSIEGNAAIIRFLDNNMNMHFSRGQENAADMFGLDLLHTHYGHAGGATELFEYMATQDAGVMAYMSTHPVSKDRIRHIKDKIAQQHWPVAATVPKRLPNK